MTFAPQIFPRSAWGAKPPRWDYQMVPLTQRTAFMAHHTAGSDHYEPDDVPGIMRGIQAFHQGARGWNDIAYNHLIDRWGRIWEGRGWGPAGGHCTGMNAPYLGVAYIGTDDVTDAAVDAFAWLYRDANRRAEKTLIVLGHRDGPKDNTTCPGDVLYARVIKTRCAPATSIAPAPSKPPTRPPIKPTPPTPATLVLKRGSRGPLVTKLQAGLLRVFPSYAGPIKSSGGADGVFGLGTESVVKEFQRRVGIQSDGEVGPTTRHYLARYGIKL